MVKKVTSETKENFRSTLEIKKKEFLQEETRRQLLAPFQSLAKFTAIAGIIALIFEVRYFKEFSYIVYISRVSSIFIAFILLVISYTTKGKRHPIILVHSLLLTIIITFGVIIFLYPNTLVFNSQIIGLIIFTAALFLSWDVKHQIIVAVYYNLVFACSIILNSKNVYILPNMAESVMLVLVISVMAIVASYINYKLREEAITKSFEIAVSEKKYRNIFENSAEGIFQVTPNGKVKTANPAFIKMLGYTNEDELKKINFKDGIFRKESEWEFFSKLLEKQGKIRNFRVNFKKKDGVEIVVRINARVNDDEEDKPIFYEGSVQDITQQVIAENEKQKALEALRQEKLKSDIAARRAQQESNFKTKFLANMSHEVRTPMNSVMGFLTLIENDLFENKEELKNFARDAKIAAESLLDIINNILDLSKIEAGKMELDEDEFNFQNEVHKAVSMISQKSKTKGLLLEEKIDPNIPEKLIGDATRFRQVLINLLSNAVKFTDEGKVEIQAEVVHKENGILLLGVSVSDTGHGIPSDKIPLLFEPYTQIKNKKSYKEGTGLGLVICKEFVKLMGGEITVESKLGIGTKFYFTVKMKIPGEYEDSFEKLEEIIEEDTEEKLNKEISKVLENDSTKKRLLLVEDNPISQNLELKILREVGYDVEAVTTGKEAIEAVQSGMFDLVLMDVEMTDMDGITATKKIRSLNSKHSKIPIIAVTAHSSMKDREKCLAAGMDDYIAKPINIHFLKITIDQWLNSRR
ncbi:ATP-binding protein [Melioribacteraceae bacterium 4301-Me]|uniref:hybrid sensor histidine kinase/response regulator n=1 Tax=Pyranulibacter aquaticus TaxID=3163344 RepID=UPI003594BD13